MNSQKYEAFKGKSFLFNLYSMETAKHKIIKPVKGLITPILNEGGKKFIGGKIITNTVLNRRSFLIPIRKAT
jgi:hypothetical protein